MGMYIYSIKATVRVLPPSVVESVEEMYLQLLDVATFTANLLQFTEDTWKYVQVDQCRLQIIFGMTCV